MNSPRSCLAERTSTEQRKTAHARLAELILHNDVTDNLVGIIQCSVLSSDVSQRRCRVQVTVAGNRFQSEKGCGDGEIRAVFVPVDQKEKIRRYNRHSRCGSESGSSWVY